MSDPMDIEIARLKAQLAEERIHQIAALFRIPDGAQYLNDCEERAAILLAAEARSPSPAATTADLAGIEKLLEDFGWAIGKHATTPLGWPHAQQREANAGEVRGARTAILSAIRDLAGERDRAVEQRQSWVEFATNGIDGKFARACREREAAEAALAAMTKEAEHAREVGNRLAGWDGSGCPPRAMYLKPEEAPNLAASLAATREEFDRYRNEREPYYRKRADAAEIFAASLRERVEALAKEWARKIEVFRKHRAEDDSFIWLLACLGDVERLLESAAPATKAPDDTTDATRKP